MVCSFAGLDQGEVLRVAETAVPAAINYWRFRTDKWKRISEAYRPDAAVADD